ncbi:MAG: macro domain-containing protein [Sphaerochaeta sp.]|nr:macro domain-containing protein [Sphaerochaeta sp.]
MPFFLYQGDITSLHVDALVNAANRDLKRGGGVCGAIFAKAGSQELQSACDDLAPINTGEVVMTSAFKLKSRYIIHAVGPVWYGGKENEEQLLTSCYQNALVLAQKKGLHSIAFPLISAGIYGYPKDGAYHVAVSTILAFLEKQEMTVYLVLFEEVFFKDDERRHAVLAEYVKSNLIKEGPHLDAMIMRSECTQAMAYPLEDIIPEVELSFSQSLMHLIREKGLDEVEVYKGANIDRKHFSKIRSNDSYQPNKRTVIAFALSLKLNRSQTSDLLESAGFCLSHSYLSDIIIEYFIENKEYDIHVINEVLFSYGQSLLGA